MPALGLQQKNELLQGGFDPLEVQQWETEERKKLMDAGFSWQEVDEHFGIQNPDMGRVKQVFEENFQKYGEKKKQAAVSSSTEGAPINLAERPKVPDQVEQADTFWEAIEAGWDSSVLGLLAKKPDMTLAENSPMYYRIASQVATLVGDFPAMVAGGFAGGVGGAAAGSAAPVVGTALGGVLGTGGGAFALPAGMRQVLMDHYEKGDIKDFGDFWERASAAFIESAKGFVIGAATSGAGTAAKLVAKPALKTTAQLSAEIATMTTVGHALEGEMPNAVDFLEAAVVVGGLHGVTHVAGKMRKIYAGTGVKPEAVVEQAMKDPAFKDDLLSENTTLPKAYEPLNELPPAPPKAFFTAKNGEKYSVELQRQGSEAEQIVTVSAFDASGKKVGEVSFDNFENRNTNFWHADALEVDPAHQRAGVATALYDFAQKNGIKIEAANSVQTEEGKAFREAYGSGQKTQFIESGPRRIEVKGQLGEVSDVVKGQVEPVEMEIEPRPRPKSEGGEPPRTNDPILKNVVPGPKNKSEGLPTTWDEFQYRYIHDYQYLDRFVELAEGKLSPKDDPAVLAKLTRGVFGKAQAFIDHGTFKFGKFEKIGKGFKEIMKPVKNDLDGFRKFILAEHTIEAERVAKKRALDKGLDYKKAVPWELKDAEDAFHAGKEKYGKTAKEFYKWRDEVFQYLVDSEVVSKEKAEVYRELYQSFVPLHRLAEEGGGKLPAGKGLAVRDPIKGRTGSERPIIDPLETVIKDTYLFITMAERNNVLLKMKELTENSPEAAKLMVKEKTKTAPIDVSKEEIAKFLKDHNIDPEGVDLEALTIFRPQKRMLETNQAALYAKGKREVYRLDENLAKSVNALDRESMGLLVTWLSKPASWLRAGSVLSPEFIGRNPMRDQVMALINSKNGYIPAVDALLGLKEIFTAKLSTTEIGKRLGVESSGVYEKWLMSGGANATLVAMDRAYIQENVFKLAKETSLLSSVKNVALTPLHALRALSELSENATRLGEFRKAISKDGSIGGIYGGAAASREVSLDFARVGAKTRAVNAIISFWNAHVQGLDKMRRAFQDNPTGFMAKAGAAITLPSVYLWWANHDDPRWKEIPRWQKDLFWIVMTKDTVWRIPKPFELGILFGSLPERVLEAFFTDNPNAFKDFSDTLKDAFIPEYVPTALDPFIESFANRSRFTKQNIVPQSMEGFLPEYQYTEYTSETAKILSKFAAALPGSRAEKPSPMVIENYIRGWSGALGMYAVKVSDQLLQKAGVVPEPLKPASTLADEPFIKAFVVRYPSQGAQSIQDFYDNYNETKQVLSTIKELAKRGDIQAMEKEQQLARENGQTMLLSDTKEALTMWRRYIQNVSRNPELTPKQKREIIDGVYYEMIYAAKLGNQYLQDLRKRLKD